MRFVNRHFRNDIHERFILTMEHLKRHSLRTVLDVGCGSGRYEIGMAEVGVTRAVGVDFSPNMIALAIEHTRTLTGGGVELEFTCADFMSYRTEERFDAVIAMGLFDYIQDPVAVLEKMRGLARHSVLASFPSRNFYRTPIRKIRYRLKDCPVWFYDGERIERLVRASGFARYEITKIRGAGMDYFAALYV